MAFTTDQLAALEKAIATGALRVRHGQQEVTYRSLDEMRTLARDMRRALGLDTTGSRTIIGVTRR